MEAAVVVAVGQAMLGQPNTVTPVTLIPPWAPKVRCGMPQLSLTRWAPQLGCQAKLEAASLPRSCTCQAMPLSDMVMPEIATSTACLPASEAMESNSRRVLGILQVAGSPLVPIMTPLCEEQMLVTPMRREAVATKAPTQPASHQVRQQEEGIVEKVAHG